MRQLATALDGGASRLVLKGATGTGKTFAMSQLIERVGQPTLVLAPNKVLAAQLWSEIRAFFPRNAVHYFVSYYVRASPPATRRLASRAHRRPRAAAASHL